MDKQQIVVGLDIGTTKIACLIGVRDENNPEKIKIIGHGKVASVGVVHGVVKNIVDAAKSIKYAVEQAAREAGCTVEEVYVGIAGQHITSMKNLGKVSIPTDQEYITEDDIKRLIEEQNNILVPPGHQIIHIFPQTYYVDNEELRDVDPIGVPGKQLSAQFHIVIGNETNIKNIIKSAEHAGLKVKGIVLEPIASAKAVLTNTDLEAGVALVDIGGGTTDMAIFTEGVIRHTHVIPLAGQSITDDIQKGCIVLRDTAEKLKVKFGSCMPEAVKDDIVAFPGYHGTQKQEIKIKTLASIIRARTSDIMDQVCCELDQNGLAKQLVAGIVLTGGGAKLKDIVNYTSYKTRIHTRIGTPNIHLSSFVSEKDEKGDPSTKTISDPIYATAVGLVLYGLEKEEAMCAETAPEETPQPAEEDTINPDILDNVDEQPQTEPEPTPTPTPEPATTKETKPKNPLWKTFGKKLDIFLGNMLEGRDVE